MNYYPSKVWKISFHIVISGFLFCYTFGVFNPSALNISASLGWGSMESTYITIFSFFVTVGALIGASISGSMMSRIGRRKSVMLADLIMIFASGLSCIPFTATFSIGRFIAGFAAGIFMTVPPSFVNEITPDEMLPKTGPLVQMSTNMGLIFAYGLGLVLPTSDYSSNKMNEWWIVMFAFPGFIAIYQFSYFYLFCKHDSPLWLLEKGKKEESIQSLAMVYTKEGINEGLKRFSKSTLNLEEGLLTEKHEEIPFKSLFSLKKYKKMMRIGVILAIIQQVSGINAGVFYSTSIYMKISGSVFEARLYTFITSIVFLLASAISIPLLGIFGRVSLLFSGQVLLAIDLCVLGVFVVIGTVPDGLMVAGVMLIFVFFAYSLGSTLWMYLGEACIDKALGVSATVNLIFVCIVTGLFPVVVQNLGIQYAFFFFGGCMVLGSIYSKFDLVETKGKSKQEVLSEIMKES